MYKKIINFHNYDKNFQRHCTKFGRPGNQAPGICTPLNYDILLLAI